MSEKHPKHLEDAMAAELSQKDDTSPPLQYAPDLSNINKAKVIRKMDIRIIPVVTVLYLFSFLDRGYVLWPPIKVVRD